MTMVGNPIAVAAALLIGVSLALYRFARLVTFVAKGQPDYRFDRLGARFGGMLGDVFLHRRLIKIKVSGIAHALIFSGFLVLLTAIVEAFGEGLFPGFNLDAIGGATWIALLQDLFGMGLMVGVVIAVFNRFYLRPERFSGSNTRDASIILLLIVAIVLSMYGQNACRMALASPQVHAWRPLEWLLSELILATGLQSTGVRTLGLVFYWSHILSILAFLIYIPGSKHLHMFVALPNIFFRNTQPKGYLTAATPETRTEGLDGLGALTWKHTLDLFACTECGRCQAACPAYAAGQPLSPKRLIMDLRDNLLNRGDGLQAGDLAGDVIGEQTLWACTTCRACMDVCPLHIEHVPKITSMRAAMVEKGRVEPLLQDNLSNLMDYGNSFGKPGKQRPRWTRKLKFKIKDARKDPVDVLWFVGDFASFDERVQDSTRRIAEILHEAGVDFGILYDGEQNSGNDVKRVGEFGLFRMLAESNIGTLRECDFKRVMTTDPHSLNALRNEYARMGFEADVIHYSELLLELLRAGKLAGDAEVVGKVVTYHDPCYLGRYNGGFDAPRELIKGLGCRVHEMVRSRERSFCCGAGGGRIWMDDSGIRERPSENRIREALALNDAELFVVACPKDVVMYTAALSAVDGGERMVVKELSELIAMKGN